MTLPSEARLITIAAMAKPLSNPLTPTTTGAGAGRGAGAAPLGAAGRCAVVAAGAAAAGRAAGGAGGATARGAVVGAAAGTPMDGGGGPPAGKVGSLIVGDEVGLGGKLMRTVSFLGWIFAASAGLGGNAPGGTLVGFSDISFSSCWCQSKVGAGICQTSIARFWRIFEDNKGHSPNVLNTFDGPECPELEGN